MRAEEYRLSPRSLRTLALYREIRVRGATEVERGDRMLAENLAAVDAIYREYEREQAAKEMATQVAMLYAR